MRRAVLTLIVLASVACGGIVTDSTEQGLCTIEDQQAGTCPPTLWLVDLAVDQAEEQYGTSEAHWAQCVRESSGWKCTTRIDFSWGWVLTTCHANGVCWSITSPTALGSAAPPERNFCPVDDELCVQELQQRTAAYAQEQISAQLPTQPVGQVPGGCGPQNCRLDVYFPSFVVRVSCHRHDDGTIHCTSTTRPLSVSSASSGAEPSLCTEGDPNCGDPGGGGGPGDGPDVAGFTEVHASSVALQYQQSGHSLAGRTAAVCNSGDRSCLVTLDFGGFYIHVTCFDSGPPAGVVCWSHTG